MQNLDSETNVASDDDAEFDFHQALAQHNRPAGIPSEFLWRPLESPDDRSSVSSGNTTPDVVDNQHPFLTRYNFKTNPMHFATQPNYIDIPQQRPKHDQHQQNHQQQHTQFEEDNDEDDCMSEIHVVDATATELDEDEPTSSTSSSSFIALSAPTPTQNLDSDKQPLFSLLSQSIASASGPVTTHLESSNQNQQAESLLRQVSSLRNHLYNNNEQTHSIRQLVKVNQRIDQPDNERLVEPLDLKITSSSNFSTSTSSSASESSVCSMGNRSNLIGTAPMTKNCNRVQAQKVHTQIDTFSADSKLTAKTTSATRGHTLIGNGQNINNGSNNNNGNQKARVQPKVVQKSTPGSHPTGANVNSGNGGGNGSGGGGGGSGKQRRLYKCRHCPFETDKKNENWQHIRIHMRPEKVLACGSCQFVTEYKHHLEYHQRNHSGYKPFKCDHCEYQCVNKSMLNSHMKSHSQVYNYQCGDCKYATKYVHSLKMHLRKYNHQPAIMIDIYGRKRGPKSLSATSPPVATGTSTTTTNTSTNTAETPIITGTPQSNPLACSLRIGAKATSGASSQLTQYSMVEQQQCVLDLRVGSKLTPNK